MALNCTHHTAFLYDRGGTVQLGHLTPLTRVVWGRVRDDISTARVYISTPSKECAKTLAMVEPGRVELVIYRGQERVWEGPVTLVAYEGGSVKIEAKDVMHYVYRTIMRNEYDNRYPNHGSVLRRVDRILKTELSRKEALDPPINVVPYLTMIESADDAGTSAHTLPFEYTAFEHIDEIAARGGLDYVTIGRQITYWDTHTPIGQTPSVSAEDFLGDIIITSYGMDLATFAAVTDGKGRWGQTGGVDPYYGLVEILDTAYGEAEGEGEDEEAEPVSEAEMRSQAQRILSQRNPTPTVVRVPDGSTLNPNGALQVVDLVPGVFVPLHAELPGRTLSQMQKLDKVEFEEIGGESGNAGKEEVKVTLSPAPGPGVTEEPA